MFCNKCGAQVTEDSVFCQKCGAKVITDEPTQQPSDVPTPAAVPTPIEQGSSKKTKKKLPRIALIIGAAVIVVVAAILIIANWNGKIDYIASAKAWVPFGSSGISETCGTVFDKYITSCKWTENVYSDDLADADASGTVTYADGSKANITIKIEMTPGDTPDTFSFRVAWGKLGDQVLTAEEAQELVRDMFDAYATGADSMAEYYYGDVTPSTSPSTTPLPATPQSTPDATPSELSISGYKLPPDQKVGAIFGIRGVITSNYKILSVTVGVYDEQGNAETIQTAYPDAYSYDIKNLDYDIYFDILTPGTKIYAIDATDEMGFKTLVESEFTVYN